MAQEGGLHWGTKRVGAWASLARIKKPRLAIWFVVAGALSFWLPDVAIHIYAGRDLDSRHIWAITILAPVTFLLTYVVARTFAVKSDFTWLGVAMLLGVWFTGGLFITLAAAVTFSTPTRCYAN